MIDPLPMDEDALAEGRVPLAARPGDRAMVMMAGGRRLGVTAMAAMSADRGGRDRDTVMMAAPARLRSGGRRRVMVMTPMLHGRGGDRRRLGVMAMVTVMDRRGGCGRRRVMMVTMMRGRRVGAARDDEDGERHGGDDGRTESRSHASS
jgi:hypothetical protein